MKTELKYKTFEELLSDIAIDFRMYNTEGMIEPAQLIKVAQRVNYELGLRINQTKETVLEIENGKTKLPDDFDVMNHAFLIHKYTVTTPILTGRQTEDVLMTLEEVCDQCGHENIMCNCNHVKINDCGTHYQVIQKCKSETRVYEEFESIEFKRGVKVDKVCPNLRTQSHNKAEIKNGYIYTTVTTGKLYISYQGAMEDEDGNLLVLDHPLINEFYEYAIKQRILENLLMNGEDVMQKINLIEQRLRPARNNALSLVNTGDYAEFKAVFDMNRKAMYQKYYRIFI